MRTLRHHALRWTAAVAAALLAACQSGSDGSGPGVEGLLLPGYSRYLAVSAGTAYVGDPQGNFVHVVDLPASGPPLLLTSVPFDSLSSALAATPTRLYAGNFFSLRILNVSNRSNPTLAGEIETPTGVAAVALSPSGVLAYVADQSFGLRIVDVSNASDPVMRGGLRTDQVATAVAISGAVVYLSAGNRLLTIDVSSSSNPVLLGDFDTGGRIFDIAVSGSIAYVANQGGLQLIDVSMPRNPTRLSRIDSDPALSGPFDVDVVGNRAYLADSEAGVAVFDVSVPASPILRGRLAVSRGALQVIVLNGKAYVAAGLGGLQILDVAGL